MADKRNIFYGAPPQIFQRAKELRNNMTKHELMLWEELKTNKLLGLRFKAQHPINSFIADFYCHKLKLVIEIDGETHDSCEAKEYDEGRESEMKEFGIQSIRFSNLEVENDLISVIECIEAKCLEIVESSNLLLDTLKGKSDLGVKQSFVPTLKGGTVYSSKGSPLQGVGGNSQKNNE